MSSADISLSFQTATTGSLLLAQTLGNSALMDCDRQRKKGTECATDADTIRNCSEVFGEASVLENPKPVLEKTARPDMEEGVPDSNTRTLTG